MLKPPSAYRPWLVRRLHDLLPKLWAKGVLPDPDLKENTLFESARAATGLTDFGQPDFLPAMRVYLESLSRDANLNPLGRMMAHGQALMVLMSRARTFALLRDHPEWASRPLIPPVVIAGPMRSGTTRLQRLMALHPGLVHLRLYEATFPVPPRSSFPDLRVTGTAAVLKLLKWWNPATATIHPTSPREPDEELGLLEQSFWGALLEAQRPVPTFARWAEDADARPAYRHLATLLRMIGGARGDDPGVPWLLKTPQHMGSLDVLTEVFPGARIIMTDRDPAVVVASSASLAWNNMVLQTDSLDPRWVGAEWLRKTRDRMAKAAAFRASGNAPPILDLGFERMSAAPLECLERALAFAGLDFPRMLRQRAEEWLSREAARGRHSGHVYRLEDFGLDENEVRETLAPFSRV